jgi:hypothetical protein
MAQKPKTADQMLQQLDGVHNDRLEIHVSLPAPFDVAKHTFTHPVTKCRTHDACSIVRYRPVRSRA